MVSNYWKNSINVCTLLLLVVVKQEVIVREVKTMEVVVGRRRQREREGEMLTMQ